MERISFHVCGLPPKKDGANSMWGKRDQAEKLAALRRGAREAFAGRPPLARNIRLTVAVHVGAGARNSRLFGDLDTLVAGVCDGLMRAAPRCKLCREVWERPENRAVAPHLTIGIADDSEIIHIQADRVPGDGEAWYDVTLEGES